MGDPMQITIKITRAPLTAGPNVAVDVAGACSVDETEALTRAATVAASILVDAVRRPRVLAVEPADEGAQR
jgi:hypothetical protein